MYQSIFFKQKNRRDTEIYLIYMDKESHLKSKETNSLLAQSVYIFMSTGYTKQWKWKHLLITINGDKIGSKLQT